MKYTDLIFDLYGTLVDIHTEESPQVWEKTAMYFGFYGAQYSAQELQDTFRKVLKKREAKAGQRYECYPDIPFEQVMEELFREKGISENTEALGRNAAQLFRISSIEYIKLYPYVKEALDFLRRNGFRLWLLSNAQRIFTAYELELLGLKDQFDGIYLSSDFGCRKPDTHFFRALIDEQELVPSQCLMIGNDRNTDIAGAKACGLDTLYMHTNLTPPDQAEANPENNSPAGSRVGHFEFEGWDWQILPGLIVTFSKGKEME